MKKTKIICSIGPASDSFEVMSEMVNAGMDCARINLSHATKEGIINTIEVIRKVRKACNAPIAQLYNLGVEIEENSELDLFEAFNKHAPSG